MPLLPFSIPSPPPEWESFTLTLWSWSITIRAYALIILLGIVLATVWVNQRLKARRVESGVVLDVIIWAVPLGLLGARLYHVFTHAGDYFYDGADPWALFLPGTFALNPNSVWAIWSGGNAIFGALIGGAVGAWIGCRFAGLRFWSFADALAPAILLAQALGRLGNYFNRELFGTPTDLPWGLEIEASNPAFPVGLPEGTLFHPTFLYEMIWNVVGIVFLLTMERQFRLQKRRIFGLSVPLPVGDAPPRLQWGTVWALYMVWYGIGRFFFESIRVDPSDVFFGLRSNQWAALAAVAIGVVLFMVQRRRHPGAEPSAYVPGKEWQPDSVVDSPDTYSDTDDPGDAAADVTEQHATSGAGATSS